MAVYVFGSNDMGQLGLPEDILSTKKPTCLTFFNDKKVKKIACGKLHVLVLCEDNSLYSWGVNDEAALGRDGNEERPELVKFNKPIEDICAGASFSGILCTNGQVYLCGTFKSSSGVLGLTPTVRMSQKFIQVPNIKRIKRIFAGLNHIVMIDRTGSLWAVGANESQQLGWLSRPRKPKRCLEPALVLGSIRSKPETMIVNGSCGGFHTVVINSKKQASGWGSNCNGQLGNGTNQHSSGRTEVPLEDVRDVACGETFTIFLTEENKVYGCGDNSYSQLAQEGPKFVESPCFILENVQKIAAGRDFTLAQVGNKLVGWGLNLIGELCTDETQVKAPKEIEFDFGKILDFKCGSEFSVVLTE